MQGLDISFSKPSQQWWHDRRAEGFEVMVQNLWTGGFASNDGIKAVASTNLRRARLAGYKVAAYANASPPDWWSLKVQMDNIINNAGAEWGNVKDVVIDVEIPGITISRVMELADRLQDIGRTVDVLYSAKWYWSAHMGNSTDPRWKRFRIWPADYDGDPTIDWPRPFGPWELADLIGKQYAGTTYIEGQAIDLNTFRDSWLSQPPVPELPEEPPVEEDIVGKIKDMMTRAGAEIEAEIEAAKRLPVPIKGDKGDSIVGPAGPTGPSGGGGGQATYTVVSGDTLGEIASAHGVSTDALYAANQAVIGPDMNLIQPGQVLVIP